MARGLTDRNPAGDIKPGDVLPERQTVNYARIEEKDLPDVLRKVEAYQGSPVTRLVVHDGFGVWCATRRLNQGRFTWPSASAGALPALTQAQFDALVVGLPWQRLENMRVITRV